MNDVNGVYSVTQYGTFIRLENSEDKNTQYIDYFEFERLLYRTFPYETVQKICYKICTKETVIIDFTNQKAMVVKYKQPNYINEFIKTMSSDVVAQYYEEIGDTSDMNKQTTILGENNAESIS